MLVVEAIAEAFEVTNDNTEGVLGKGTCRGHERPFVVGECEAR